MSGLIWLISLLPHLVGIHKWCWSDECIWSDRDFLKHLHEKYPEPRYRERIEEVRKRTEHIRGRDLRG